MEAQAERRRRPAPVRASTTYNNGQHAAVLLAFHLHVLFNLLSVRRFPIGVSAQLMVQQVVVVFESAKAAENHDARCCRHGRKLSRRWRLTRDCKGKGRR